MAIREREIAGAAMVAGRQINKLPGIGMSQVARHGLGEETVVNRIITLVDKDKGPSRARIIHGVVFGKPTNSGPIQDFSREGSRVSPTVRRQVDKNACPLRARLCPGK